MRIERFIEEYAEPGFQFAFHLCADVEQAKELVQEAFFKLLKGYERYDASQPPEKWFLTILRHLHYDGLKKSQRRRTVSLDAPLSGEDPEGSTLADRVPDGAEEGLLERLERRETGEEVQAVLEALSPEYRAILTLCDLQGLGYGQIAEVLDCPLGTVRSRVFRARLAFRKKMLARAPAAFAAAAP